MNACSDKTPDRLISSSVGKSVAFHALSGPASILADGDFRTYVFLCALVHLENRAMEQPFTELTYAEMAARHPGRRLTAETLRGRIYRLMRAGLVRRERVGRTVWRTYPLVEQCAEMQEVAIPEQEAEIVTDRGAVTVSSSITPDCRQRTESPLGERDEHTHERAQVAHPAVNQFRERQALSKEARRSIGDDGLGRVSAACGVTTHPAVGVLRQPAQKVGAAPVPGSDRVPQPHPPGERQKAGPRWMGEGRGRQEPISQNRIQAAVNGVMHSLDAPVESSDWPVSQQVPDRPEDEARRHDPETIGAPLPHTQDQPECVLPTHPEQAASRACASVLSTGTDLHTLSNSFQARDQSELSTDGSDERATKGHPVLERVEVPAGWEDLAIELATMGPKRMNYEGIAECLRLPELTRAWFNYVEQSDEMIRNPPAYIRTGVRSGQEPPKLRAQKSHTPKTYGWDDPTISLESYRKYKFDNPTVWVPPHLAEQGYTAEDLR